MNKQAKTDVSMNRPHHRRLRVKLDQYRNFHKIGILGNLANAHTQFEQHINPILKAYFSYQPRGVG